jgi:hypothetical protein
VSLIAEKYLPVAEEQIHSRIAMTEKVQLIKAILHDQFGMGEHFARYKQDGIRHTVHCADYIKWFHFEKYNVDIEPNEGDVIKVLKQILNVEYIYLQQFSVYLSCERLLTPTTIINYMGDLQRCFTYMCAFAPARIKQPIGSDAGIVSVLRMICKTLTDQHRKDRPTPSTLSTQMCRDIADLVPADAFLNEHNEMLAPQLLLSWPMQGAHNIYDDDVDRGPEDVVQMD